MQFSRRTLVPPLAGILAAVTAGQLLPSHFEVTRTRYIDATPDAVVDLASDLTHPVALLGWRELADLGPLQVGDVSRGVGAWAEGEHDGAPIRVEVQLVEPGRRVVMARVSHGEVDGVRRAWPDARTEVRVEPSGAGSKVTWRVQGAEAARLIGPYVALLHTWMGGRALDEALHSLDIAAPSPTPAEGTATFAAPVATAYAPLP
jgi:hypothetical protein